MIKSISKYFQRLTLKKDEILIVRIDSELVDENEALTFAKTLNKLVRGTLAHKNKIVILSEGLTLETLPYKELEKIWRTVNQARNEKK